MRDTSMQRQWLRLPRRGRPSASRSAMIPVTSVDEVSAPSSESDSRTVGVYSSSAFSRIGESAVRAGRAPSRRKMEGLAAVRLAAALRRHGGEGPGGPVGVRRTRSGIVQSLGPQEAALHGIAIVDRVHHTEGCSDGSSLRRRP